MKPLIPYPLRATKLSIEFNPFGWWWLPSFVKRDLTERAKEDGNAIWWARWLFVQITFSRWV